MTDQVICETTRCTTWKSTTSKSTTKKSTTKKSTTGNTTQQLIKTATHKYRKPEITGENGRIP